MVPRGHPRDSAPGSSPPGELPAPTEGKDRWHPGHLSAPSWVKPFALTRMPPPKPQSPGQSRLPDCTPDPLELILQGAVSSFLAGPRVSGAQDAQHHTDPHLPQESARGRRKDIQRRSESIGKTVFHKGVHSGGKAQTLPTFKRQPGFQEGVGRPLPTPTSPETRAPPAILPYFLPERNSTPSASGPFPVRAITVAVNGHLTRGDTPSPQHTHTLLLAL
ncbi:uncharacterized protein LOC126061206 isoform X2 [Elephas maximus indicus]|uniref:uncharacterized protein LOC126061206 isoform X2 n=1 Tax=Elephas maximus indicus TaxID=99487 RepID=UPI002116DCB3|nr:uncharacterized protein LOC126061206 isoform X2 [Elephas maximus indicus]